MDARGQDQDLMRFAEELAGLLNSSLPSALTEDLHCSTINSPISNNPLLMNELDVIYQLRQAVDGKDRLILTSEQLQENHSKFGSLVIDITEGNHAAFERYKSSRFIHWNAIPAWARPGIVTCAMADWRVAWKEMSRAVTQELRPYKIDLPMPKLHEECCNKANIIDNLGLSSFPTATHIEAAIGILNPRDSSSQTSEWLSSSAKSILVEDVRRGFAQAIRSIRSGSSKADLSPLQKELDNLGADPSFYFSPLNTFKLGQAARASLSNLAPKLVSAMLVEDLCHELKVPASNSQKQNLWAALKNGIPNRSIELVGILYALSEVFEKQEMPIDKRKGLTQIYLAHGKMKSVIKLHDVPKAEPPVINSTPKETEQKKKPIEKTPLEVMLVLYGGIYGKTEIPTPERESLKRLARLIPKGIITLGEALEQIQNQIPIDTIRQKAYEEIRLKNQESFTQNTGDNSSTINRPSNSTSNASELSQDLRPSVIFYHHGERSHIVTWMKDIEKSANHLFGPLEEKIEKLRSGQRTNCRRIESIKGEVIFELKHSDLRVYFRYLPSRQVELLLGGTKDEQDEDIETLKCWFP